MTDEDRTNWPSAIKSAVSEIALAAVIIMLALQLPPCCQSISSCQEKRDAQDHEERLREMSLEGAVQESRKAEVPGDDRPVPELQSDGARGKLQGPGQEPGP